MEAGKGVGVGADEGAGAGVGVGEDAGEGADPSEHEDAERLRGHERRER